MPGGGGGGVIFDAISRLKSNRAQRTSKRPKFNGNYSQDTILTGGESDKIQFPTLPEKQVFQERERIRIRHQKRKRNRIWILAVSLVITSILVSILYVKTQGFEYWDAILPM